MTKSTTSQPNGWIRLYLSAGAVLFAIAIAWGTSQAKAEQGEKKDREQDHRIQSNTARGVENDKDISVIEAILGRMERKLDKALEKKGD